MDKKSSFPLIMTDLGRLLAGADGSQALTRLMRALDDEAIRVRRKMSSGLSQGDYVHASQRVTALDSAQMILKALQIYLGR